MSEELYFDKPRYRDGCELCFACMSWYVRPGELCSVCGLPKKKEALEKRMVKPTPIEDLRADLTAIFEEFKQEFLKSVSNNTDGLENLHNTYCGWGYAANECVFHYAAVADFDIRYQHRKYGGRISPYNDPGRNFLDLWLVLGLVKPCLGRGGAHPNTYYFEVTKDAEKELLRYTRPPAVRVQSQEGEPLAGSDQGQG